MASDKLICIMRFLQKPVIDKTNTKAARRTLQSTKAGPSGFVADRSSRTQFEAIPTFDTNDTRDPLELALDVVSQQILVIHISRRCMIYFYSKQHTSIEKVGITNIYKNNKVAPLNASKVDPLNIRVH